MKSRIPSPQYSITIRLECPHQPGWIARIAQTTAEAGAAIQAIDLVNIHRGKSLRDYSIECTSSDAEQTLIEAIKGLEKVKIHSVSDNTYLAHLGGKLEVSPRVSVKTRSDLSMVYTPGVARVCNTIHADPRVSFNLTIRRNCIAVVSDGSAVLGLGNIGPEAAMPVMEGKAVLFKRFGEVDAFPICVETEDPDELVLICKWIAPTFGGINLEDISSPRCFHIEDRLRRELSIPVFHDDQHGTAVVVLAALINALKLVDKKPDNLRVVVAGAGAAGTACTRSLHAYGVGNIVVCDSRGAIHRRRDVGGNPAKEWLRDHTNADQERGTLRKMLSGADVFLGLSTKGLLSGRDVRAMNDRPVILAMANPTPEILPEEIDREDAVIATGRSDYPNQINNVLAFPGIFRGALDARAREINEGMKHAAANAIAGLISREELLPDYIIPGPFHPRVHKEVARAVSRAAHRAGVARRMPKGFRLHT